jgi:hypothetical protein
MIDSQQESKSEATVTPIWTEALYGEETVLASIRNNHAIVRVFTFDIEVQGEFEIGDIESVMLAYRKLITTKPTITKLPDDWEPPPWNPPEGFDPIADLESEPEEEKHEVIYLNDTKRQE